MKLSFWQKLILRFTAILLMLFGLLWFGLIPQAKALLAARSGLKDQNEKLNQSQNKLDNLNGLVKAREANQLIQAKVNELWPDQENVSRFIVQLEDLANKNGIVLNSLSIDEKIIKESPAPATEKKGDEEANDNKPAAQTKKTTGTQFTFDTLAGYPSVFNVIASLEQLDRYNSLANVNLTRMQDNMISLRINGRIYAK